MDFNFVSLMLNQDSGVEKVNRTDNSFQIKLHKGAKIDDITVRNALRHGFTLSPGFGNWDLVFLVDEASR
jgi:hypothetical protein